jgi:glutamine amidotransferase
MITIIDYGMGNLASVENAVKKYTKNVRISSDPHYIATSEKIILPGVGAFKDAYYELDRRNLLATIVEFIGSGKPFLGICLGLQLLFTKSYEDGEHTGLNIIKGEVVPFERYKALKVPHMGWNSITYTNQQVARECQLLKEVPDNTYMYFVHSYYVVPADISVIGATTDYGVRFCSFLWKDNIYAMQFHPERSHNSGLKIIENFVGLK